MTNSVWAIIALSIIVLTKLNQPQVQPVLQPLLPLQEHQLWAAPQPGKDRQRQFVYPEMLMSVWFDTQKSIKLLKYLMEIE